MTQEVNNNYLISDAGTSSIIVLLRRLKDSLHPYNSFKILDLDFSFHRFRIKSKFISPLSSNPAQPLILNNPARWRLRHHLDTLGQSSKGSLFQTTKLRVSFSHIQKRYNYFQLFFKYLKSTLHELLRMALSRVLIVNFSSLIMLCLCQILSCQSQSTA